MGIIFNGNVTINGNVEMYDNGSMKITTYNEISIPITELKQFIEENLRYSVNKKDYLEAADVLKDSTDKSRIEALGVQVTVTNTIMKQLQNKIDLANVVLKLITK